MNENTEKPLVENIVEDMDVDDDDVEDIDDEDDIEDVYDDDEDDAVTK